MVYYSLGLFSYLKVYDGFGNTTTISKECIGAEWNTFEDMDLFNSTLIPFTLMFIFTLLTLKSLYDSRRRTHIKSRGSNNDASKMRDKKFAITTVTLVFTFLILNLPVFIYNMIDYFDIPIFYSISFFLLYLNFTSIFFINISVNSVFKKEFFVLFRIKSF